MRCCFHPVHPTRRTKSILKSDFVQALIILAGVVVLFVLRRKACAGDNFPQLSPSTLFNEDFSAMDLFFLLVTYSVTFVVGPDIYSRIFVPAMERWPEKV